MFENMTFDQIKELLTLATAANAARATEPQDRTKAANPLTDADRERIASVGIATHGKTSPYAKAFDTWMRRGPDGLSTVEKTTMVEGTGANGGYAVPAEYADELVVPLRDQSYLRNPAVGARQMDIEGTNAFHLPAQTDSAAAALVAESGAYGQSEPTLGDTTFVPYKYGKLSKVAEELLADSRFDIWGMILQPDYVQAFAAAENTAFTTGAGTGSSQPQGFVTGATTGVTLANSTSQVTSIASADRLLDLYFALNYKYRPNAVWMMNDATLAVIRGFKDSNNRYILDLDHGLDAGGLPSIMGRPVITNNSMAVPAASAKTIAFGDFSYFRVADFSKGQVFIQRLNELYAGNGQVGFRAYKRVDSHVMLATAIQLLQQAAS